MEVIFLYGLRPHDSLQRYRQDFEDTHALVSLDSNNRHLQLRNAVDAILEGLRNKGRIVVLDEELDGRQLKLYTDCIRGKVSCGFKCIVFRPKFDKPQAEMFREFARCRALLNGEEFSESVVEEGIDCEGVEVIEERYDPVLAIDCKLEVPVLMIQYSAVVEDDDDNSFRPGFEDVLHRWNRYNACGSVVLISERVEELEPLEELCGRVETPFYVCHGLVETNSRISILSFLIPFLHMDVDESYLLYETESFRQMADDLGLRSCPAETILRSPSSVAERTVYADPEPNVVLENLQLRRLEREPAMPLCNGGLVTGRRVTESMRIGACTITLLARDRDELEEYDTRYGRNATRVGDDGNLREFNLSRRVSFETPGSSGKRSSGGTRGKRKRLPEWLATAARSPEKRTKTPEKRALPTEYVMNERELLQCAESVLRNSDDS